MANISKTSPHYVGNPSLEFKPQDDKNKMMTILPSQFNIVWGNDERYWNLPTHEESPAKLNQVSWLEVTASVDKIRQDREYEVGFKVSLTPDAFGWGSSPLYVVVKRGKDGKIDWSKYSMVNSDQRAITAKSLLTKPESKDPKLYFGLYEVWSDKWKGGLLVHQAFIRELMPLVEGVPKKN